MLRLRSCILTHLISSPSTTSTITPLHRFLSTTLPPIPANPAFAVEEYLVATYGLTRAQALKASTILSHLKSPSNPDAFDAGLGLGLSSTDVATLIAKDPKFLCTGVERTLAPIFIELPGLSLSHTEVARLVSLAPKSFRCRSISSNLPYYLSLFGSYENLLQVLKKCSNLLSADLERVVKPNVELLRECGLGASDITRPRMLNNPTERVRVMVACAECLGVPRSSGMFRFALRAVESLNEEKIAAEVDYLKNTFRWSDAEVHIAVSKAPTLLTRSNDMLDRMSEFLISEAGLEPAYIARLAGMITYSLEGRLRPRYYVVKFLKENEFPDHDWGYNTIFKMNEKVFVEKLICPHKESVPHLAEDYAAACRGKVPLSFRFT